MTNGFRIEVGDRVRSVENYADGPHEGTVQSIALGVTAAGPAPILRVMVDRSDGEVVEPHLHESAPMLWNKVFEDGSTQPTQKDGLPTPQKCPNCGETHGTDPFTPEMISLYQQFVKSGDEEEKLEILLDLGNRFFSGISSLDPNMPEWAHEMVEDVIRAQQKMDLAEERYKSKLLRVGRLVLRNLSEIGQASAVREHLKGAVLIPIPMSGKKDREGSGSIN